jgi:mono/diheme cytochrome c family protein
MWKSAAVKGPANCAACHTRADDGEYSERTLRLPK